MNAHGFPHYVKLPFFAKMVTFRCESWLKINQQQQDFHLVNYKCLEIFSEKEIFFYRRKLYDSSMSHKSIFTFTLAPDPAASFVQAQLLMFTDEK